ncbi:MAG: PTS sugar transporter subunit IIA [Hyphomicrobium sp.]|uniref:PTS sugar transporter subunit IIA n=1 Tax=Hyphomicrobium sp. TaxID=82 RepID=UPI00132A5026|nr:PTS sugar transporter subunit IIA [Hyphomicrobium sp.]KAB2942531.1 MAG: transcriptional regulator [Hyphomicrobium sp.]MBZ0208500.1 PTS sugar transporter subunit IIA [Hyphomicrobium sp.]
MDLCDLLASDGIIASLKATSKKHALQELATIAASRTGLDQREIFNTLLQRERLGSTGLGRGIAIPHVKLAGMRNILCLFARLDEPIDYESNDNEPVDLLFLLLAPEHASGDHLKALASISRVVREPSVMDALRNAPDVAALRLALTRPVPSHAA